MKIKLMYSESWWAKPEGLFLECSVRYLELRLLKLKYTWELTLCLLQIIEVAHRQYKFRSQWWLRLLHVRTMHERHLIVKNSAQDYNVKLRSCICSHTDSSCPAVGLCDT